MGALFFAFLIGLVYGSTNVSEAASQYNAAAAKSHLSRWDFLNSTLGGRLQKGTPLSAPCFPVVDGKNVTVNSTACAAVQKGYTDPLFRAPIFGAYMLPQWEGCQSKSQQCLLDSSNTANPAAWTDFTCSQGSIPPYYIDVRSASDVQAAYAFSLATGVRLSIKNSGHDYKGRSSGRDALALWMHNLQSINYTKTFVPDGCKPSISYDAITLGAGAYFQLIYAFAEANNITFIGGYQETIAASGGWVQGGGHSILSPNFGLGMDRAVEFKIVTPDGEYRVANECQNNDLFWALRGGGAGTWGVVLETSQKVEPQLKLQVASISFNQTATNPGPFLKIVTQTALTWGKEGWGGHIGANNLIKVNPRITLDEAIASMKNVSDYAMSQNGKVTIETLPSWYAFFQKYVLGAEAAVGGISTLGTRLIPTANFETEEGLDAIYETLMGFLPVANPYIVVGTPFLYNYTKGSTSSTPAWRDSLWHLGMHENWQFNATTAQKATTYQSVSKVVQSMRDIAPNSGAYFNEGDVYEANHEQAFWGDNYPRLLSIKKKYDPHGLLDCWQCVGWKGANDPRYSCWLKE